MLPEVQNRDGALYADVTPSSLGLPIYTPMCHIPIPYSMYWKEFGEMFEEQISELERKKEEYTNLINLFKLILLFEKPKDGEEKEADKLIEKIYNTYIKKEGE